MRAVRARSACGVWAVALASLLVPGAAARAQTPDAAGAAPPGAAGTTAFLVENVTRAELWRYFQPPPNAGTQPDYELVGSRATLGAAYDGPRWAARGALQYVRVENLPAGAIGPGLLGTGGAYYFQAAGTFSYQFYLRGLSLAFQDRPRGLWIEAGRFSRAASTERPTGDATIDRHVADELNGRLLGDMEWSFYQRAWDGVRGGVRRDGLAVTITAALPTQGTFEESANLAMDRVKVAAAELSLAPGALVPRTRLEAFALVYDDTRRVSVRPDNTNHTADRADIRITTLGASAAGAYPSRRGTTDAVAWIAGQAGSWYGQSHRAMSGTVAAGHRLPGTPWQPWLRAGLSWASGDGSAVDGTHGTFFPMLPSGDRVSGLNAYALMNIVDRWTSLELQPHPAIDVRTGLRRVDLASSHDRWYQGSGATIRSGNYFGFQGRNGRGGTQLGTVVEGAVTWRARRWWTLRGYAGRMAGGDVVRAVFAGRRLLTGWIESTVQF